MLDESLFAGTDLHEREVEVAKGRKITLWFKELPAVEFLRFHALTTSKDEDVSLGASARLISACVVNPDGSQAMTYEKALTLKNRPLNVILSAVLEVNGSSSGKL